MDRPARLRVLALLLLATGLVAALLWPEQGQATPEGIGAGIAEGIGEDIAEDQGPPLAEPPGSGASTRLGRAATEVGPPATGLHPGLRRAFAAAVSAAGAQGHALTLTSGFRTADEQARLLAEAVVEHGSEEEARRWVFPPERSMHVRGLAVDVGDRDAARWLDGHGAAHGLCRTLAWEWWHFEWREAWEASGSCPGPVDDPAAAP